MRASHRLLVATAAVTGTIIATPAIAQRATTLRVVAVERAAGDRVIVVAKGSASRPTSLVLKVTSQPQQRVRGQWLVSCHRGGPSRSTRGTFDGRTTLRRTLRMAFSAPRRCQVSASAQLTARGRIRLTLLRR